VLAKRASSVSDSITMAITATAQRLKKEGQNVLSFGAGEPDFDTPDFIKEAGIKAIRDGKTKYTAASGIIELKQAVCEKLKRDNGLTYSPNQIVISCGAKHSIFNAMMALVDDGDEVIIPSPYWVSYPDQVQLCGGKPIFIETTEATEFKITPAQLLEAITPRTKLFVLGSPSNPTGSVYSKAELEKLAEIFIKHNILVISDEIYEKLIYGDHQHVSIASLSKEMYDRTIVINGVSKAYSMTGWRIGYSASPAAIASAMGMLQSHATSNPATPSQWASVEALTHNEDTLDAMRIEFKKRRTVMVDGLNKIPGFNCIVPHGAFYTFPNISGCLGKSSKQSGKKINTSADFCEALLNEALVACVPGSGFGTEGYIRLSYATSMTDITEGIERIHRWVSQLA
jgi:aspartate aminotransferase